jgi:L-aspartate oxidase
LPSGSGTDGARDVAVVGGGAAGLHVALEAAESGAGVVLISRKPLDQSASFRAQGGLAAAIGDDDSPDRHAEDTLTAGRGACRPSAVRLLTEEAPAAVRALEGRGVRFDGAPGPPGLGLEGGHSRRRIVHAGGSETGRRITGVIAARVEAHPGIEVMEGASAVALWSDGQTCAGVITDLGPVAAAATVLATGGAAALWRRTTNPWGAIGAGAVLAHTAGADLADLEFNQFHPTALAQPGRPADGFLVTEAIRGEGAVLIDAAGERFTDELAPRDAVTMAIIDRMRADGASFVRLDMRGVPEASFPNVFAALRDAGLRPDREPVPVAPAAHYTIGGVATDLDGRSSLPGLLAVGECACTGLHGANRLASNSLSECFVFGARAAAAALSQTAPKPRPPPPDWRFAPPTTETRDSMWRNAGPLRTPDGLSALRADPYSLARMIAAGGLARQESRGSHRRQDRPEPDPALDRVHLVHDADSLRSEIWE